MKQMFKKGIIGLLTAVLCTGGVYAADPVPTWSAALDTAEEIVWENDSFSRENVTSSLIDISNLGWWYRQESAIAYSLGTLTQEDVVRSTLSSPALYDGDLLLFYKDTDGNYQKCDVADGVDDDHTAEWLFMIPQTADWYAILIPYANDPAEPYSVTFEMADVNLVRLEEALENAPNRNYDKPYKHELGTQYTYDEENDDSTYINGMYVYNLGELNEGDHYELLFYGAEKEMDTTISLYYQAEGSDTIESADSIDNFYYDSDPDNYNGSGTQIYLQIPVSGTWYAVCEGYSFADTGSCYFQFINWFTAGTDNSIITQSLDFSQMEPTETETYIWRNNTLTLKNGFCMQVTDDEAIIVPCNTTIVVQGNAAVSATGQAIYMKDGNANPENVLNIRLNKGANLRVHSITEDAIYTDASITITGDSPETSYLHIISDEDAIQAGNQESSVDYHLTVRNLKADIEADNECLGSEGSVSIDNCVLDMLSHYEEVIDADNYTITINNSVIYAEIDDSGDEAIEATAAVSVTNSTLMLYAYQAQAISSVESSITIDGSSEIHAWSGYSALMAKTSVTVGENCLLNLHVLMDSPINVIDSSTSDIEALSFYVYNEDGLLTPDKVSLSKLTIDDEYGYIYYEDELVYRLSTAIVEDPSRPEKEITDYYTDADVKITTVPEPGYNHPPMPNLFGLSVKAGEGGTANASGNLLIALYATRNLKFTPDEGYEIADVLVNGESVGAVSSYKVGPATKNISVEVRFAPIPVEEAVTEAEITEAAAE